MIYSKYSSDLKSKSLSKIYEHWKDMKCLLTRYREFKHDEEAVKNFCSRYRNPFFDISNIKFFKRIRKGEEFDILNEYLNEEKSQYEIFPYPDLLYNAFNYTSYDNINVVDLDKNINKKCK